MRNTQVLSKIKNVVNYLKKNNLTLESKTLKILNESLNEEDLPKKYYPIFKLNAKITNLFLSNPLLWNDATYQAVITLSQNYNEPIVLKYMVASLYEPPLYWDYLQDDRIPKVTKKNYYNLIKKQQTSQDMALAYKALIYPMLRNNKEALEQINKLDQDNNRDALKNKINILNKAYQTNIDKYKEPMQKQIALFEDEEAQVVQKFFNILIHYDEWEIIRFLVNYDNFKNLYPLMASLTKVQNVDEFYLVWEYFAKIVSYLKLKENITTMLHIEIIEYDEYHLPILIEREQKRLFANGYSNTYLILEEMKEEFRKKTKEKDWDLSRLKI